MNIKEYISSGILELYVLGQLSEKEMAEVRAMQNKHVEVRREIFEIELALEKYGQIQGLNTPSNVEQNIFENLPPQTLTSNTTKAKNEISKTQWKTFALLFGFCAALGVWMYFIQGKKHQSQLQTVQIALKTCDSLQSVHLKEMAVLRAINEPENQIVPLVASKNYAGISIYLHHNKKNGQNFIQLLQLPTINEDQAFQLWALKPGADPMPLDVFTQSNTILPVTFVDGAPTYAITIEPKGGSQSPNLNLLLGTMSI